MRSIKVNPSSFATTMKRFRLYKKARAGGFGKAQSLRLSKLSERHLQQLKGQGIEE